MSALVSVIIPMYNCSLYIERCIVSLLAQTYDQIEILIVDDGSTDNSGEIVKTYARRSDRIKYYFQQNSGPGRARNKAIEESKGKYLLFVDADDYLDENYIQDMVQCAEANKAELVIAGYTFVYEDSDKKIEIIPSKYTRNISEEWAYRISSCWARLYLKEFWIKNSLKFHENKEARAEDLPIALYSNVMAKNISVVNNAGYYYQQHKGSAMNLIKRGVVFLFPYDAFKNMYLEVKKQPLQNSIEFFDIGVIKALAHFEFVIYRKKGAKERKIFNNYVKQLIKDDKDIIMDEWKRHRKTIQFPLTIKIAIELFLLKYKNI